MLKQFFLLFIGVCMATSSPASINPVITPAETPTQQDIVLKKIAGLKIKDLQKLAGRKFTLKEKIAIKFYQWRIKKNNDRLNVDPVRTKKGKTALILGIIAVAAVLIPYIAIASIPCGILAITIGNKAKKENPDDKQAKAGATLGWVAIAVAILALIAVLIIVASGGIKFTFG